MDMKPDSNHSARLFGTAKTHKFKTLEDITAGNLKFGSIIDQTGMFTYNAAKVISDYLRHLFKNENSINCTRTFLSMLYSILCLQDNEEDVLHDVESLFANIPIQEAISYIIEQIYVPKKLTPNCLKLIFRGLLIKLPTECTFKYNNRFLWMVVLREDQYLLLLVTFI